MNKFLKNSLVALVALFFIGCGDDDDDKKLQFDKVGEVALQEVEEGDDAGSLESAEDDKEAKMRVGGEVSAGRSHVAISGVKFKEGGKLTAYLYSKKDDLGGGLKVVFTKVADKEEVSVVASLGDETSEAKTLKSDYFKDGYFQVRLEVHNDMGTDTDKESSILAFKYGETDFKAEQAAATFGNGDATAFGGHGDGKFFGLGVEKVLIKNHVDSFKPESAKVAKKEEKTAA